MKIMRAYYYLFYKFYKFYKFSENAPSRWMSEWKAGLLVLALEIWFFLSLLVYYAVITKTILDLSIRQPKVFIPFTLLFVCNYLIFYHKDHWKEIIKKFDSWSVEKNKKGSIVVCLVILAVIFNLVFAFYLMSRIDWSLYR